MVRQVFPLESFEEALQSSAAPYAISLSILDRAHVQEDASLPCKCSMEA
jgi:hypothetical protein